MTRRDWALLGAIVVLAAIVRIVAVNFPPRSVVDEFWYARDGCYYWKAVADACRMANLVVPDRDVATSLATFRELTPEHPPLAKWLIGAPIGVFGYNPVAWRLASVGAGVLTVGLLYLFAKRAFGSTAAAGGAAALLALDYPHLIHSRIAMLEIFVALFTLAAFHFCLLDRAEIAHRSEGRPSHERWRVAAGFAAGAAAACKLSGAAVVASVFLLVSAWEIAAHRRSARPLGAFGRPALSIVLSLAILPLATYMTTYAGRLDGAVLTSPWTEGSWIGEWLQRQTYMLGFHAGKPPGSTVAWALPMTERPLPYLLDRTEGGIREILLFGNPLLWWGGFAAVAFAAARWLRGERGHAELIVVSFISSYAGWLSITLTGRPAHLFYAIPVSPFLYLALAFVASLVMRSRAGRLVGAAVLATSAIAFAFYFPIITGQRLDFDQWLPRACSAQALWLEPIEGCGLPVFR